VACTADIVAPGNVEIETGGFYSKLPHDTRQWTTPFLLKPTFTKWLQVQVGSNGYTVTQTPTAPTSRFMDALYFGSKFHVLDQGTYAPSLSLSSHLNLPLFATGNDAVFLTGYVSKDFGPLHVDWTSGLNTLLGNGNGPAKPQPFTALDLSTSVPPFGIVIEGYAYGSAEPYTTKDGGIRSALSVTPRPWLVFDLGGDIGWYPSVRAFSLFFGMTIVPAVLWREREKNHE
jgi:hypothetical protein